MKLGIFVASHRRLMALGEYNKQVGEAHQKAS